MNQGRFTCPVSLKDVVPLKGTDPTQHTWLFAAAQVAFPGASVQTGRGLVDRREHTLPQDGHRGSLPPTLERENRGHGGREKSHTMLTIKFWKRSFI